MENKYQEAIELIKETAYKQYDDACYGNTTKGLAMLYEEDLINSATTLKILVDKETPIRPVDINGGKYCGRCKQGLIINSFKINSCHNLDCRQVIDWRDDIE